MEYFVDFEGVSGKEEIHERLSSALPLPSHYGRNLDALYDALTEAHEKWDIVFLHWDDAVRASGDYMDALWNVCNDAAEENDTLTVRR